MILDEAHIVRNQKTRKFKGAVQIQATHKICVSGTPIQNKPSDIASLFRLLRVEPLHDKDVFRRAITQPLTGGDLAGLDRLRTMMYFIALRREKTLASIVLPEKTVELRVVKFPSGSPHKEIHDALFESAYGVFKATLLNGDEDALRHYSSLFEALLRIRQACCSGALVPEGRRKGALAILKEVKRRNESVTP
mmetsp:Transcript_11378/g.28798  ORF Transcript_11378/g.28798 Transcript_11378/m.28798 type:complete len:193 (-) Transcript_11378:144-722(-)